MERNTLGTAATPAWARLVVAAASVCGIGALFAGCSARNEAAELFPAAAEHAGSEIEEVRFVDTRPFSADTLEELVRTEASSCTLLAIPPCIPGTGIGEDESVVVLETLRQDVARLALFYRRSGFFGTEVDLDVHPVEGDDGVVVAFVIERGERVILDALAVEGTEGILDPDSVERSLPLQPGERFDLGEFEASADSLRELLLSRGYLETEVLRNYAVDTLVDRATARLVAVPGPRVTADTIVVIGAENLGRGGALSQLTFSEGALLTPEKLVESQRNLYGLDIVQFATVNVAADSLRAAAEDSAGVPVIVRITETPVHVVEALVGYGSVECFRTRVEWASRSFFGGARRLEITGSISKIGLGPPLTLGKSICSSDLQDTFREKLDYRVASTLTQPGLLNPGNRVAVSLFVERQSEPNIFQRVAQGGRLSMTRDLGRDDRLSVVLDIEHRRTEATAAIFCSVFRVCLPGDIERLDREPRWQNSLAVRFRRDRTNRPLQPNVGYQLDSAVEWAANWLGSEVDFVRGITGVSGYRMVRDDWVLAGRLRLGTFFSTATLEPGTDFLPPEERFYAGGAGSVRGYQLNDLGPGVYVTGDTALTGSDVDRDAVGNARFIPSGGTALVVMNAELRVPAFFAPEAFRLALFVDAGAVGRDELWRHVFEELRVTPGVGLRLQTPVGPVRLDVAYNPYGPSAAPLYVTNPETGALRRVDRRFQPDAGSFLDHLRLHLAVGQPF